MSLNIVPSRRGFLKGLGLAIVAAPAIIKTPGLLMPVRPYEDDSVFLGYDGAFKYTQVQLNGHVYWFGHDSIYRVALQ